MSLPAGTPIGKYVVRRKIAEGGMAEIYLASSRGPEGFEKEVVIKRIRAFLATDQSFVQMFIAEARLVSRLNHANLVQIFDFDKHEDTYYLAMEYVRGHSLWDVRRRSKELMEPMPPTLVAQIGAEVARGLHYAHRATDKGKPLFLVHRDVTPHNVLLSFDGAVKLTDFGVAKVGTHQTAAGVLKGKFAYMAPEQARGEPVDARTDVFALGIVLWEMLTGGRLFDGDSDVAVLRAVQLSAIASPARLNPDVHPELDAVVMKALARDPALRFQTANELERALAHFVLQNAKTVDDSDVGAYLRALFVEESTAVADAMEGTGSGAVEPVSAPSSPTANHRPVREPTAVMSKGPPAASVSSPDEDMHASTHVVQRGAAVQSAADWSHLRETLVPPAKEAAVKPAESEEPTDGPFGPERPPAGSSAPLSHSEVRPFRATVGMRRGLWAGIGTFVVILAVGLGVRVRQGFKTEERTRASAPVAPAPVEPNVDSGSPATAPLAVVEHIPDNMPDPKKSPTSQNLQVAVNSHLPEIQPRPIVEVPPQVVPDPAVTGDASDEVPAGPSGTLLVRVTPWGTAWIDGRRRAEITGRRVFRLSAGKHVVLVDHAKTTKKKSVSVEEGKTATVDFAFPPGR